MDTKMRSLRELAEEAVRRRGMDQGRYDITDNQNGGDGGGVIRATASSAQKGAQRAPAAFDRSAWSQPFEWRDPDKVPPREWLYGRAYLRGVVSVVIAPGGVGKSSLLLGEALAMASGRPLLGVAPAQGKPLRVLYWNGEDGAEELNRLVLAGMLHHRLRQTDIEDRLLVKSGHDLPVKFALAAENRMELDHHLLAQFETFIREERIDVCILDPFISTHGVSENSNDEVDATTKAIAKLAHRARCAFALAHHSRKTPASDKTTVMDSRGASALIDTARIARILNIMDENEAKVAGIEKEQRFQYVRVDDGKVNLAPRTERGRWFRKVSVALGNGTPELPAGDEVGVFVPWQMPGALDGCTADKADLVLDALQRAYEAGDYPWCNPQSADWAGYIVGSVLGLDADEEVARQRIIRMLAAWEKAGSLVRAKARAKDGNRRLRPYYRRAAQT